MESMSGLCVLLMIEISVLCLGLLDHVLVGSDVDLDATVLCTTLNCTVVSYRHVIRLALCSHTRLCDTARVEVLLY